MESRQRSAFSKYRARQSKCCRHFASGQMDPWGGWENVKVRRWSKLHEIDALRSRLKLDEIDASLSGLKLHEMDAFIS